MWRIIAAASAGLAMSGCQTLESQPLIFGQGLTVGISAAAAPEAANTPELTVGVKMVDIAIVPTIIPFDPMTSEYSAAGRKITGNTGVTRFPDGKTTVQAQDALSTFGSFESETKAGSVTLGVFFATGVAAQALAEGVRCGIGPNHSDCTGPQNPADQTQPDTAAANTN